MSLRNGPKRIALLESSWAHLFREEILHKLPAEKLFPLYDDLKGRRTKELYTMLGIVLLQQMEDLTDEQAVRQFAFDIEWHYALNVTDPSDVSSYVAPPAPSGPCGIMSAGWVWSSRSLRMSQTH